MLRTIIRFSRAPAASACGRTGRGARGGSAASRGNKEVSVPSVIVGSLKKGPEIIRTPELFPRQPLCIYTSPISCISKLQWRVLGASATHYAVHAHCPGPMANRQLCCANVSSPSAMPVRNRSRSQSRRLRSCFLNCALVFRSSNFNEGVCYSRTSVWNVNEVEQEQHPPTVTAEERKPNISNHVLSFRSGRGGPFSIRRGSTSDVTSLIGTQMHVYLP